MKNFPEELFSAYLDGQLTSQERAEVERLLASSAEARQLLEELRLVRESLQRLPVYKVPEDLAARILQEARRRKAAALQPAPPASCPSLPKTPIPEVPSSPAPAPEAWRLETGSPLEQDGGVWPGRASTPSNSADGTPAPHPSPSPAGRTWRKVFRRLLNSRGLIWSAVAVGVAAVIWWLGPSRNQLPQLARRTARPKVLEEPTGLQSGPSAISQTPEAGETELFPEEPVVSRRRQPNAPTRAAIRSRSAKAPSGPLEEMPQQLAKADLLLKDRLKLPEQPPASASGASTSKPAPASSLSEQGGRRPSKGLRMQQAPAGGKEALQMAEAGGASALAEAEKLAGGGAPAGWPPLAPFRPKAAGRGAPERPLILAKPRPAQDAAANQAMEEDRSNGLAAGASKGKEPLPSWPASRTTEPKVAAQATGEEKKTVRKAPEPPGASPTPQAPAEVRPSPPTALAKKETSVPSNPEKAKAETQVFPTHQSHSPLLVLCEVRPSALRRGVFEQILSSQQIILAEGEALVEDFEDLERLISKGLGLRRQTEGILALDQQSDNQAKLPLEGKAEEVVAGAGTKAMAPEGQGLVIRSESSPAIVPNRPYEAHRPQGVAIQPESAPPLPERSETFSHRGEKQSSSPKAGGMSPACGQPASEISVECILVEATAEQVEATLQALQARAEEFLAISILPALGELTQQMDEQSRLGGRGGDFRSGHPRSATEQTTSPGPPAEQELASSGRRAAKPAAPSDAPGNLLTTLPPRVSEPASAQTEESAKQKMLREKGSARFGGSASPALAEAELAAEQKQTFRLQQGWARRVRLPAHLQEQIGSQLLLPQTGQFPQPSQAHALADLQGPSSRQMQGPVVGAASPPTSSGSAGRLAPLAKPVPASPPAGHSSVRAKASTESLFAPDALPRSSLPGQAEDKARPTSPLGGQQIRILFVLRPVEKSP